MAGRISTLLPSLRTLFTCYPLSIYLPTGSAVIAAVFPEMTFTVTYFTSRFTCSDGCLE